MYHTWDRVGAQDIGHFYAIQHLLRKKRVIFSPKTNLQIYSWLVLIVLSLSLLFFTNSLHAAENIRIGAIFSQTGIAAAHNRPLIQMVQLAVGDINQSGGVLNNPIELVMLDNHSTPIGASMAAEEAVRLELTAVIGAHWSSHSLAMAPVLQKAGIPMVSPGSTNPEVTQIGNFIFRACFLDSFQGSAMARFSVEDLGARSSVIIRNIDEDYSVMLAEFFKKSFLSLGGKVLEDLEYRGKAVDFAGSIMKIKSLKPDVVYLPGYTRDSGLFIKQARNLGLRTIFLGGDAWDEIENFAGDSIEGSFQSAAWHPQVPFPQSKSLQLLYQHKFEKNIENMSAPLAYDAVHLLADAIERAGSNDRDAIRKALAKTKNYHGATGTITFDENGDPENKDVIIIKFDKGQRIFHKSIKP